LNFKIQNGTIKKKLEKVRCKKCNRRLFDGSPGFDIVTGEPKIQNIKCPRCGALNIVTVELYERIKVKYLELPDSHFGE
jgi:phage FluMu protein Com